MNQINNLSIQEKRSLLLAISQGLLKRKEVFKPDFDFSLYTLKVLPLFVYYSDYTKLYSFMNHELTEDQFKHLIRYYSLIGINQVVITINQK